MALSWHVVETLPLGELTAENEIANFQDKPFQPFNPKVQTSRVVKGVEKLERRPYIPGYIFFRCDVEFAPWQRINRMRGVRRVMASNTTRPSTVPEEAMQIIIDRCEGELVKQKEVDAALAKFMPVGSIVKILEGPFERFEAPVEWSHGDRVRLLVSLFGRSHSVEMKKKFVELV